MQAARITATKARRKKVPTESFLVGCSRLTPMFSCEGSNKERAQRAINSAFVSCNKPLASRRAVPTLGL